MFHHHSCRTVLAGLVLLFIAPLFAQAAPTPKFESEEEYIQWMYHNAPIVNEIMVKFKPGIDPKPKAALPKKKLKELSDFVGHRLSVSRIDHLEDWQLLKLDRRLTQEQVEEICVKLRQHPDVVGADPNGSAFPLMTSTDPRFPEQWSLKSGTGAADVAKAWDISTGDAATVVAVIDTGITAHEDIAAARLLPGYDFVSDAILANDGGGRDTNAADPGDWLTEAESNSSSGPLRNCKVRPASSWHGTHITGTIAYYRHHRRDGQQQ